MFHMPYYKSLDDQLLTVQPLVVCRCFREASHTIRQPTDFSERRERQQPHPSSQERK